MPDQLNLWSDSAQLAYDPTPLVVNGRAHNGISTLELGAPYSCISHTHFLALWKTCTKLRALAHLQLFPLLIHVWIFSHHVQPTGVGAEGCVDEGQIVYF